MPRKLKKTKEEKLAEDYFPIDEDNLKYTVEKLVKAPIPGKPVAVVEKFYKKPETNIVEKKEGKIAVRRKYSKRKKTPTKKIDFSPPKISLKKDSYELIITEKPQAAVKIADALGKITKKNLSRIPYYEVEREKKKIIVSCAVGHLFTLKQNSTGSKIPVFDIKWVPNYLAMKNDFSKKYYDAILKLAKNAGSITVATDYDVEGELIGFNIIRFICGQKDANRMKFSTLTEKELNNSYENKSATINWGQAIAGETRHYLDWFYGINFSRALMNAIKTTGRFKIMSIGRVQGPALNLIVKKEREIQKFKPSPYWQVFITVKNSHKIELKHNKDLFNKGELKKFEDLTGKTAVAETIKREEKIPPNSPFNLTNLQTEAYRIYGISPMNTLKTAQSLYLSGLISYPRTSSQKIPESIGYKEILKKIAREYNSEHLMKREKPIEGKKSDPAHPSIYPTGNKQILSGYEEKIYSLIAKRFLSLFCEDAVIDNKKITATVENLKFSIKGASIRKKAWMEIYPIKIDEKEIPDVNGEIKIINLRKEQKETQPPRRYSQASIISELEKRNLGTKATRASILETLYDRGYVKEKSIEATPLGISMISIMEKHSPIIIDEKLTRDFEKEMESLIGTKKSLEEKKQNIIEKAKRTITEIAKHFEKKEKEIGKELIEATDELREQERLENIIMTCPLCKKGNLKITYSKKTRRNFIACDAYPDCKNTYSLPPNGVIKRAGKICEQCGFPMMMRLSKGKKPWIFCFNSGCPTNKERVEKYKKEQGDE
ncbi:MAG: DNA topoisomerase I [archaeon]